MEQPNCLQTERILIACLLLRGDSEVYDSVCSIVSEDDFYNSKNKNLFSCIKAIFAKSEEIDEVLLLEEIRKRKLDIVLEDIYGIQSTTITTSPAVSSAKIVAQHSRARKLLRSARLAVEDLISGEDPDEVSVQLEADVRDVNKKSASASNLEDSAKNLKDKFNQMLAGTYQTSSMPTGISHLDEKLDEGGIGKGEVMVISAPTSCGKSQLALNIVLRNSVVQNKPVGIFSFEMPSEQLAKRMIQTSAAVNLKRFREGLCNEGQVKNVMDATDRVGKAPIYTEHFVRNVDELRSKARAMKRKNRIELLVIDYLQLIPFDPRMKKHDGVAMVSHSIKQLAIELDIPVILLAQVNREGAKRESGLSLYDLKDSGDIENDADIILLMWAACDGDIDKSKKVDTNGSMYVDLKYKIAKNREGERDTIGNFKFINHIGRLQ
jgi:replicative DNA helicase